MNQKFIGTGVALATPFDADNNIDFVGLKKLLEHTANEGVEYFVVNGTTGESPTTTQKEKAAVLEFVKENNPNKLPIVFGIGGNNTAEALETISDTNFNGVDGLLSVGPSYNKPPQEGIFQHFTKIADASPVPVIMYNVPHRTSSNIATKTTLRLAEHPNIIGTKEASGDMGQTLDIMRFKPKEFMLIAGDDMLANAMISYGAVGSISVQANIFPRLFSDMIRAALNSDFEEANTIIHQLVKIDSLLYKEASPTGVKHVLKIMGICENHVRLPLVTPSNGLQSEIERVMGSFLM